MADNPYMTGLINPTEARMGMYNMRMMSAANRMEAPFEHLGRSMYAHQGVSGNPMLASMAGMSNEPDYSRFTFDPASHAAATQALSHYGLAPLEASQVKQNVLLPNTGFFGAHPRLSAALEGGIFSAVAAHGGATPGDSIQGALEGVIGGQRIRQGLYRQQFARPFEAAGMMENLEDMQQRRDLQSMEIEHLRAENQKLGRPDHDMRAIPINRNDQGIFMYDNVSGIGNTIPNPDYDPSAARSNRVASDLDVATREQLRIMGVTDPGQASPTQIGLANRKAQEQAIARGSAIQGAGAIAKIPAQNYQDARTQHDRRINELNQQMMKLDDPGHQKWAEDQILDQKLAQSIRDPNAFKKDPSALFTVDPKERDAYISQFNSRLQAQIDAENQDFLAKHPQVLEAPPVPKQRKATTSPSPKTGSTPKKIPTYDPSTGQLH